MSVSRSYVPKPTVTRKYSTRNTFSHYQKLLVPVPVRRTEFAGPLWRRRKREPAPSLHPPWRAPGRAIAVANPSVFVPGPDRLIPVPESARPHQTPQGMPHRFPQSRRQDGRRNRRKSSSSMCARLSGAGALPTISRHISVVHFLKAFLRTQSRRAMGTRTRNHGSSSGSHKSRVRVKTPPYPLRVASFR